MSAKATIHNSTDEFTIDAKRFYLPAVLNDKCSKCQTSCIYDFFEHDYLLFPTVNADENVHLYCSKCEHEWDVKVRLKISLHLSDLEPQPA